MITEYKPYQINILTVCACTALRSATSFKSDESQATQIAILVRYMYFIGKVIFRKLILYNILLKI